MRDLRNRLRATALFCAAGPVASFLPPVLPARARAGGAVAASCTEGVQAQVATRRSTFRAPVCSTRLAATTDQPEGHALREPKEVSTIDGTIDGANVEADPSTEQESPSNVATLDTPVAAAAAAAAVADLAEGRSSEVGGGGGEEGEDGAKQAPTMAAVGQEVDSPAAVGVGQSKEEEEEVMAELLAQQPGGQEENEGGEGDDGDPKPMRVRKRLKKYYPKDFQDTTWTVAVQWNHAKYEVQTTKIALKADGSVVWLDKGKGSWIMRTKSRDISIYRNFFLNWGGMRIYSAKLLNNTCDIYLSGIIKGWQPFLPLSRMGTWQAVRRGIKVDENTPRPPWEEKEAVEEVTFGDGRKRTNKPIEVEVDLE